MRSKIRIATPGSRSKWVAAIVVLTTSFGLLGTASPAQAKRFYMSCGNPPSYVFDSYLPGNLKYRKHPKRCYYTEDGSTASLVNLVSIHWRGWGGRKARARAKRVDNHDMDNNGFQRHRVRVVVYRPKPAFGHSGRKRLYYTRLKVIDPTYGPYVLRLFRPGQAPI